MQCYRHESSVCDRHENLKHWFWQHMYDFPLQQSYWSRNENCHSGERIISKTWPSWEQEHADMGLFISCLLLLDFSEFTKTIQNTWLAFTKKEKKNLSYLVCQMSHWEKCKLKQLVRKMWCSINISSKCKKQNGRG